MLRGMQLKSIPLLGMTD